MNNVYELTPLKPYPSRFSIFVAMCWFYWEFGGDENDFTSCVHDYFKQFKRS